MTKRKTNKKANATGKGSTKGRAGPSSRAFARTMDGPAQAYARLLADPCSGPIVHPVYPGGDAGLLFRAESFITFGAGATATAGVVHWVPGYVNSSSTELLQMDSTDGSTPGVAAINAGTPGKTFLAANARGARCIAACLKITYPGAESTRAGRIHYGHTAGGFIDSGASVTANGVANTLQNYGRTPTDTVELVWKPSVADTEFNDPSEVASAQIRDRKAGLTVAWSGLPVNTGLTLHFTAVYEWMPLSGLGVANNSLGKAISRNSLDDVVDSLLARGFKFVQGVGHGYANGIAQNAGMFAAITANYGIMRARGYQRALMT